MLHIQTCTTPCRCTVWCIAYHGIPTFPPFSRFISRQKCSIYLTLLGRSSFGFLMVGWVSVSLLGRFPDVYTGSFYTAWQVMIPTLPNQLGGSWGSCSQHGSARITLRPGAVRAKSELRVTFVCSQDLSVRDPAVCLDAEISEIAGSSIRSRWTTFFIRHFWKPSGVVPGYSTRTSTFSLAPESLIRP